MIHGKDWGGVFPVIATTFDEAGALDLESQVDLAHYLVRQGAHGFGLFGNASEGYTLSEQEKRTILDAIRKAVGQDLPLIANTGQSGTMQAVEAGRAAQDLGADALMVMPPWFLKTDADGMMHYYQAISDAVKIPIMVQDAPLFTQVAMPAALLSRMGREIENVKLAKVEAPPTAPKITAVVNAGGITPFGGLNGNFFIEEHQRGSRGIMPGSDMIGAFREIWDALEAGQTAAAWSVFARILPLIRFELQPGLGVSAMKHNLMRLGVIRSERVRHPTGSVDTAGWAELDFLREMAYSTDAAPPDLTLAAR